LDNLWCYRGNLISVRGLKEFINGEYKYAFEVEEDFDYFNGVETIYKNDKIIYVLRCSGRFIKWICKNDKNC